MSKFSPRVLEILESAFRVASVPLNVSIKRGLSVQARDDSIDEVRRLCTNEHDIEFIPISGTVHCELPIAKLSELAAMPQVEWIDIEKEAPLEELLD